MKRRIAMIATAALLLGLAFAAEASATTFCVPNTSFVACPAGSTAQASLETAMQLNAADGNADMIFVAAGTQTETTDGTFTATGSDPLEVVGAGPGTGVGATRLTSTGNANQYVVNLANRSVTFRDLTIVIPASFPNNLGGGLLTGTRAIENVDIESQNPGSDGATLSGGGSFSDGQLYATGAGSISVGFRTAFPNSSVEVTRTTVINPGSGAAVDDGGQVFNLRRSRIINPVAYGVLVSADGIGNVTNSVIQTNGTASALEISETGNSTALLTAGHVTMVRTSGADTRPAVVSDVSGAGTGTTSLVVRDSIIRGFANSYSRTASGTGTANLSLTYSDLAPTGPDSGTGSLTLSNNINADPLFAGATDFHILAGSPAIDAADPNPSPALIDDFDGALRPTDGDGDGVAIRDMGAYEFQPPPVVQPPVTMPPASGNPATLAPKKKRCKKKRKRSASAAVKKKCKKKKKK
jgi:hypothetical protein